MRRTTSAILWLLLAGGCTSGSDRTHSESAAVDEDTLVDLALVPVSPEDHQRFDPVPLAGTVLSADQRLGEVGRLLVDDNHLWVQDFSASPWLHLIDRNTGEYITGTGTRGEGPGDFAWLLTLSPDAGGGVWAADGMLPRVTLLRAGTPPAIEQVIRFPDHAPMWTRAVRLGNRFVAMGRDTLAQVVVVSDSGELVMVREAPLPGPDSVPVFARLNASSNHSICARPSGDRFAVAYNVIGRADRFDADGNWLGRFQVPFPKPGLFTGGAAAVNAEEWIINYEGCSATDQRLYLLYSGARFIWPRDQSDSPDNSKARMIHVFGWDGKRVAVYQLDRAVTAIAVSPDDRELYGADADDATLVRYRLP